MISRVERVPIRDVWEIENQFSNWLYDNIDILSELLNFELINAEREKAAGSFRVDIYAEDEQGNSVIIENQFGRSDHDHLGKIITYLSAFESKKGIWIVEEPRAEHIQAINYLNESASEDYYLIQLEAIKIGNSPKAPLLTKIIGPSEEFKKIGDIKKEKSEEKVLFYSFWDSLLKKMSDRSNLFSSKSPEKSNAIWVKKKGIFAYQFRVRKTDADVIFFIEIQNSLEDSVDFFRRFVGEYKDKIDSAFGEELKTDFKESRILNYLKYEIKTGGYENTSKWDAVQDEMINKMILLEKATRPYLNKT